MILKYDLFYLTYNKLYGITCLNRLQEVAVETFATVKGQIVIPASIRRKFGIKEGTRIQIELDKYQQHIILTPITREHIHSLRGKYKGKGLLKAFATEKKKEREL